MSDSHNHPGWGPSFIVTCPFGHRKGAVKANVNIEHGTFHCHDCGKTVSCYEEWGIHPDDHYTNDLLPNESLPQHTSVYQPLSLANYGGPTWGTGDKMIKAPGKTVLLSSLGQDHPAVEYLRGRGCNMDEIMSLPPHLAIYYCTYGVFSIAKGMGSTTGRIIFPIHFNAPKLPDGSPNPINPVGWQARQIERVLYEDEVYGEKEVWNGFAWRKFLKEDGLWEDKHVPKYYTMPGFKKSDVLYNFDTARRFKTVTVAEGVMDVMSVGASCVGSFGMVLSMAQINLIKNYWDEVIILRDPGVDPEGEKFKNMLDELTGMKVTHLTLSGGRDPGSTERSSIWQQIAEAVDSGRTPVTHQKN